MDFSLIPPSEVLLVIPKVIEICCYLFAALSLKKRGQQSLNKLFIIAFLAWAITGTLDIFQFLFAAVSFDAGIATIAQGYDLAHPSLLIANILRDIGGTCVFVTLFCILLAPYIIQYGVQAGMKKIFGRKFVVFLYCVFTACVVYFDQIKVTINVESGPIIDIVVLEISAIFLLITVLLYLVGAIRLWRTMYTKIKGEKPLEKAVQRRILLLALGVLIMAFGYIFAVVVGILASNPELAAWMAINVFPIRFLNRVIFSAAPVLMFFALRGTVLPPDGMIADGKKENGEANSL